jgi:hypothetical protein
MFRFSIVSVALLIAVAGCTKNDSSGTGAESGKSSSNSEAAGLTQTVSIKVPGMT